jgi:predicted protein tyrosine phosphatase
MLNALAFDKNNRLPHKGPNASVIVWSREYVEYASKIRQPHIVISMTEHSNYHPAYSENKECLCLLRLHVDDIIGDTKGYEDRVMSTTQAECIASIVKDAIKQGCKLFVCQCEAGISRSAAVAQAIYEHFNGPDSWFEEQFAPNKYILGLMRDAFSLSTT